MPANMSAILSIFKKHTTPSTILDICKKRAGCIPKLRVDIWGSCVTRDSLEFADNIKINKYCARSSIISAVASPAADDTINMLKLKEDIRPFHRRVIDEDLRKTALRDLDTKNILIVDFIEERVPIGLTLCGTYITYSRVLNKYSSNGKHLLQRMIQPFSDEHIELFLASIDKFAEKIGEQQVFIHKALYAKGERDFKKENEILSLYYERAAKSFSKATIIEVDEALRISNPNHKWGAMPYHYIDAYYRQFLKELSDKSGKNISYRKDFSLHKESAPSRYKKIKKYFSRPYNN